MGRGTYRHKDGHTYKKKWSNKGGNAPPWETGNYGPDHGTLKPHIEARPPMPTRALPPGMKWEWDEHLDTWTSTEDLDFKPSRKPTP